MVFIPIQFMSMEVNQEFVQIFKVNCEFKIGSIAIILNFREKNR